MGYIQLSYILLSLEDLIYKLKVMCKGSDFAAITTKNKLINDLHQRILQNVRTCPGCCHGICAVNHKV